MEKARLIVSTVPEVEATSLLMKRVRKKNKNVPIFVTAESIRDALFFYEEGADYVIIPRYVGGKHVSSLIHQAKGKVAELRKHKRKHLDEIQKRLEKPRKHS